MAKEIKYWENLSKKISDPSQTKNKRPDTSDLEVEFYSSYFKPSDEIIDIGSGSGLITNKMASLVKSIWAIEKYEGFTKFIEDSDKILVINADIIDFKIRKKFDGALLTGVAQCFRLDDIKNIYSNIYEMLKDDKFMIVRMQCGLEEEVTVNGFSEELQTDYFANYRQKDAEIALLKSIGFKNIEVFDIFPDSLNIWKNTRHFIFICKK